jgi:hypothetical protein|tara:strand:+ start:191 stop:562 length:372 start_codon:yes stop_codon:yes gene_type:complete
MVLSKKAVQFVSGGIISSYITTHYLEESKHLGVFKQSAKMNVNRTLKDLIKIEEDYFNETENVDDKDLSDKLVSNKLTFIDEFLKFDFADFTKLQEVFVAFTKDRKRLVSISDRILIEDKAKK